MGPKIREKVQDQFLNDKIEIMCATIAFGMGIDKSNVRWVIHYNLPKNLESHYQEIGRAGRDGLPSDTMLLYSYADVVQHRKFMEESGQQDLMLAKLDRMEQYANARVCRRSILLSYFGEHPEAACGNCDVCENPPQRFDGTILAQKALSAVYRMRQEVGMGMLIDVLRGSRKKELLDRGFDQVKTYGAGSDMSAFEWQHCILQMMHLGILELAYDQNKTLRLTNRSMDVLQGNRKIEMVRPEIRKKSDAKKPQIPATETAWEGKLFEELRKYRFSIAQSQGVPPYVVFSDFTLKEMVKVTPLTEVEMRSISGVGNKKWERYGERFIEKIKSFMAEEGHAFKG
ncbi:MAG: RQC domain-containing protein [Bacteroidota bacterium]